MISFLPHNRIGVQLVVSMIDDGDGIVFLTIAIVAMTGSINGDANKAVVVALTQIRALRQKNERKGGID